MGFESYNYGIFSVANFCDAYVAKQTSKKILHISIDSRDNLKNSMFVCLQGNNTDGHNYISSALKKDVAAILVSRKYLSKAIELSQNVDVGILVVDDPLVGLQHLAKSYISQFPKVNYSAITGSCGKSTTKQALAALLSTIGNTVCTPGNLNSEIGLPLSLLNIDSSVEFGVFEMGIDHKNEMDRHLYMVKPNQALITNIGLSHVEKLGSVKGIAKEKRKIFHKNLDYGFVSKNCKLKNYLTKKIKKRVADYCYSDIKYIDKGLLGYDIIIDGKKVGVPILGEHQLEDIAGAMKVATYLGATKEDLLEGLSRFKPMVGRGSVVGGDITVIEDCYNASPDSTTRMLGYLKNVNWNGGKKVVLGSMKELGRDSRRAHSYVAKSVFSSKPKSTFLYGKEMETAYSYLKNENYGGNLVYSDNFDEINYEVGKDKQNGDLFLLKGSRAMEIERLIPTLQGVL